jgi:ankyrin repeat protein
MSAFRRTLPARPDLEQQRTLAKELLAAFRNGDGDAVARVRDALPDKKSVALADAQFVLAREYGFASWRELKEHVERLTLETRPPVEQFKAAVGRGDARALRRLLDRSDDVRKAIDDTIFGFGATALLASGAHLDVVDVLLEFGADPNKRSDWWAGPFHPLHGATGAVAERLLAAGSNPDACGAANLDRPDLLARMIAEDPARVHERGGDGKMPLHFARSRRVVDLLLDAGADIDARDIDHRSTAAEWMIGEEGPEASRPELAKYLVARGAHADIFLAAALGLTDRLHQLLALDPSLLTSRTAQGEYGEKPPSSFHIYMWTIGPSFSPMQTAAKFRQDAAVQVMKHYASPAERLLLACHEGRADEARDIVRSNPDVVARLTPVQQRALTDEAWLPNAKAVAIMMELGFDPSVPSVTGPTGGNALHCACWEGSPDAVGAILAYPRGRALLDVRENTYGGTPLSWCCHGSRNCGNPMANHAEVARLLLAAGAALDPQLDGCGESMQAVLDAARKGR